jgi:hypothetical protein
MHPFARSCRTYVRYGQRDSEMLIHCWYLLANAGNIESAIDQDALAGNESCLLCREPDSDVGDVCRLSEAFQGGMRRKGRK